MRMKNKKFFEKTRKLNLSH